MLRTKQLKDLTSIPDSIKHSWQESPTLEIPKLDDDSISKLLSCQLSSYTLFCDRPRVSSLVYHA